MWQSPSDRNPQTSDSADLWVLFILQAVVFSQNLHRLARLQRSTQDSTECVELNAVVCAVHLSGVTHQWTLRKEKEFVIVIYMGLLEVDTFLFYSVGWYMHQLHLLDSINSRNDHQKNSCDRIIDSEEKMTFWSGHSEMPEPKPVIRMIGYSRTVLTCCRPQT